MNDVTFQGKEVRINDLVLNMPYAVLDAFLASGRVIVLLNPDSYMADEEYRVQRRRSGVALRNLIAFSNEGSRLWEAEFPQDADYYYKVTSRIPLVVYSFSSYACEIDVATGKIKSKLFFK